MPQATFQIIQLHNPSTNQKKEIVDCLEPESQEERGNFALWGNEWFAKNNKEIPGEKYTVIATYNKKIIGITMLWKSPYCENKWLIEGLYVMKDYRNKGIGLSMMEKILSIAKNIGANHIYANIKKWEKSYNI